MRRGRGFRLLDGVIIASVALLALKSLPLISGDRAADDAADPPERSSFARVLSHARTNYEPVDVTSTGSVSTPPKAEAKPAERPVENLPPPMPQVSISERAILEKLGERREELRARATETEQRERLLEESERKLDQRLEELKALQKTDVGGERRSEENDAIKNLVVMYESMKPKEAAKVFDRLPQAVLVSVATQMKPRKMSEVLAAMSPAAAEKLTVALARSGREQASPGGAGLPAGELPAIEPSTVRR